MQSESRVQGVRWPISGTRAETSQQGVSRRSTFVEVAARGRLEEHEVVDEAHALRVASGGARGLLALLLLARLLLHLLLVRGPLLQLLLAPLARLLHAHNCRAPSIAHRSHENSQHCSGRAVAVGRATRCTVSYLFEALGGLRAVEHRHLFVVRRRVLRRAAAAAAERVRAVVRHAVVGPAGERERVAAEDASDGPPRDAARVARRVLQEGRRRARVLRTCGLYGLNREETERRSVGGCV